jgi:hypothetical protein
MSDTVTKPHFGTVSNMCDSDSDNLALSLSQRINLFWLVTVTVPTISKDMCCHTPALHARTVEKQRSASLLLSPTRSRRVCRAGGASDE